jgi:hypothetical protein
MGPSAKPHSSRKATEKARPRGRARKISRRQ